jgi:HAD superfamily hydrolase (TIGR01490 family)
MPSHLRRFCYDMVMKRLVAVFDIDGTLCSTALGVEFLKEMSALGAIRNVSLNQFDMQYDMWLHEVDRTKYYDQYLDSYYDSGIIGVEQQVFNKAGKKVAAEAAAHFYKNIIAELKAHQAAGRFIILISKSPEPAVAETAKLIHADAHWGWQFHFDKHDAYTGQYVYPDNQDDKAVIIRNLSRQYGLDLDDSYAYGDSIGDISLLEMVAHPTVVNPEPELLALARTKSWRILRGQR